MKNSLKTLTIQEVSQRLGLTPHTLRFWEKALGEVIVPLRTKGGQRRYTLEHLFVIDEIKRLKSKGLSLANIKEELHTRYNSISDNGNHHKVDLLANRIADIVKSTIQTFFEQETVDIEET